MARGNGPTAGLHRRRVAIEAARLIAEQGLRDYHLAKRKAATRLGLGEDAALPSNREIEAALREHQRLFQADSQPRELARLRGLALEAMEFLAALQPRLVGAVLEGTADTHSVICLHVFSDDPLQLTDLLGRHAIDWEELDHPMRMGRDGTFTCPALRINADGAVIDISMFPLDGLRQAPLDRISERPMQRAGIEAVRELIATCDGNEVAAATPQR